MFRLLHHIITYQVYVDLRDRALPYLKLLTHAGSSSLGVLMRGGSVDVDRETEKLARVLPKTICLVNAPVPLSHYLQVVGRAKKVGHSGSSVFGLPLPSWKSGASHTPLFVWWRHK